MAIAITCMKCGFIYGFQDEEIEYAGFTCPQCKTTAPKVDVEVDERLDEERVEADTIGDNGNLASTLPAHSVIPETIPAVVDGLDILLFLWIAESIAGIDVAKRLPVWAH